MGFLNYPPEIMNQIYHELFVDQTQILVFLCSTNPLLRRVTLKQSTDPHKGSADNLHWSDLYDSPHYTDSTTGRSAQFLRVCRKFRDEGAPVLYGNLKIAMRRSPAWCPCLHQYFRGNAKFILPWADIVYPKTSGGGWTLTLFDWGATHSVEPAGAGDRLTRTHGGSACPRGCRSCTGEGGSRSRSV
jgi:hypothetical protein